MSEGFYRLVSARGRYLHPTADFARGGEIDLTVCSGRDRHPTVTISVSDGKLEDAGGFMEIMLPRYKAKQWLQEALAAVEVSEIGGLQLTPKGEQV